MRLIPPPNCCQKLRGIPDVPSQRITDLEASIRQMRQLSCILDSCTISASYKVSQAQKAILLMPRTAKGASTSFEELNAQMSPLTDEECTRVNRTLATLQVNRFGHRALPASCFIVERKELRKSMMIGKARCPRGSDCRWSFDSPLVHGKRQVVTRRKAMGAAPKKVW